jgi:hypothetical protein
LPESWAEPQLRWPTDEVGENSGPAISLQVRYQ